MHQLTKAEFEEYQRLKKLDKGLKDQIDYYKNNTCFLNELDYSDFLANILQSLYEELYK